MAISHALFLENEVKAACKRTGVAAIDLSLNMWLINGKMAIGIKELWQIHVDIENKKELENEANKYKHR